MPWVLRGLRNGILTTRWPNKPDDYFDEFEAAVEVHIQHTWIGDLVVDLVAPDGTAYNLHNRAGGSTDNIDQTYTRDLSSEAANGTWTLRVTDAATFDTGFVESWSLDV